MPLFALFGASGQTGRPIAQALRNAGLPYGLPRTRRAISPLHALLPRIRATSYDDGIAQTLAAMKWEAPVS
jgi:hypothetical protein